MSSQMFANHISEEAVDLIVASIFLDPAPHVPPATPTCAFVRFLKLLSTHDWQSTPLVVDINSELTGQRVHLCVFQVFSMYLSLWSRHSRVTLYPYAYSTHAFHTPTHHTHMHTHTHTPCTHTPHPFTHPPRHTWTHASLIILFSL